MENGRAIRQDPSHSASPGAIDQKAAASTATSTTLVGMGVPSKYFTLPVVSSASAVAVALNRARRLTPHTQK